MIRLLIHRIAWGIPVLLTVATITFLLMRAVPGGPFDREKPLPPEIKANVEAKYHLDRPAWEQYLRYIGGLATGDLGPSYKYLGRDVRDIIVETLPVSVRLGALALLFALALGVPAGVLSATAAGRWPDRIGMLGATVGFAVPNFILGAFLILLFSHGLRLFPPALWEGWRYIVLPAITLGAGPAAYIARLTRSSVLESLDQEYVRAARAKGLPPSTVLWKHALRNAFTPVLSYLGPLTAALVTGSFVVEYLFSIPGMGKFFITAVTNRDYPLIMGVTLVYAALIVAANLAVDIGYGALDPRVRVEGGRGGRSG